MIAPYDKTSVPAIEKAVRADYDIGVTHSNDGNVIRLGVSAAHRGAAEDCVGTRSTTRAEEGGVAVGAFHLALERGAGEACAALTHIRR